MTKQQEFLESLKDPTQASLLKASREFQNTYPNLIDSIRIKLHTNGDYAIHIKADKHRSLVDSERTFVDIIHKHVSGIMIDRRNEHIEEHIEEHMDGTFTKTYYASWSMRLI